MRSKIVIVTLLGLALGCGAAGQSRNASTIAIERLLGHEADGPGSVTAVSDAVSFGPADPVNTLLVGLERFIHGHLADANDAFLATLELVQAQGGEPIGLSAARRLVTLSNIAPHFRDKTETRVATILQARGMLIGPTRFVLTDLLIELALRRGDIKRVRELATSVGCPLSWRVAGPFGFHPLLSFDENHAPGLPGPMADAYDLGPELGRRPTRDHDAVGCAVHVGADDIQQGGTTYAKTSFEAPTTGKYLVRLDTPNTTELVIDGKSVVIRDRRKNILPQVSYHSVALTAGRHEFLIKLSSRYANPVFGLSVQPSEAPPEHFDRARWPGSLGSYLETEWFLAQGDVVSARKRLEQVLSEQSTSPITLALLADARLADPLRGDTTRRDQARTALRRLSEVDPDAWVAPIQLARLAIHEGRNEESLTLLKDASARWPDIVSFPLTLAQVYEARGWRAQQARAIVTARELETDDCEVVSAELQLAQALNRMEQLSILADRAVHCDAFSTARLRHLLASRRWQDASKELDRLVALEPTQRAATRILSRVSLARAQGEDLIPLLEALRSIQPDSVHTVLEIADLHLSQGSASDALANLQGAFESNPSKMLPARLVYNALSFRDDFDDLRLDGRTVIREFEASGRTYDHSSVLILDYTASRVFHDGSVRELTHNIFKVQGDEAIDALGEFSPPPGADVLKLRTIKPDGRVVEPDWIPGKESISLTKLRIGDYVEYEFVRSLEPSAGLPGGVLGERFYFRTFDTPFDRSEYVVAIPRDRKLIVDSRGDIPNVVEATQGDERTLRWRVEHSTPIEAEPGSINMREFVPSVAWGLNVNWQSAIDTLLDGLADRDPYDPDAQALVDEITHKTDSEEERARKIYAWVMDEVEHSNDTFGLAPAMLHDRSGHRSRVLHYLLSIAGLSSELVLARHYLADQTQTDFPEDDTYTVLLVRVHAGDRTFSLEPAIRSAPFGFLSPGVRGQGALTIARPTERIVIQDQSGYDEGHRISVDVKLRDDGVATIAIAEALSGYDAVRWREDLRDVSVADLESKFEEQYLPTVISGGELKTLQIDNLEEYAAPLILRYVVEVERFARRQGDRWHIPTVFRSYASPNYARLPSRNITQVIAVPTRSQITVSIALPEGHGLAEREVGTRRRAGAASFEHDVSISSNGKLLVTRTVDIPRMRIAPANYRSFAEFCRDIDRVEAKEIAITVGP